MKIDRFIALCSFEHFGIVSRISLRVFKLVLKFNMLIGDDI